LGEGSTGIKPSDDVTWREKPKRVGAQQRAKQNRANCLSQSNSRSNSEKQNKRNKANRDLTTPKLIGASVEVSDKAIGEPKERNPAEPAKHAEACGTEELLNPGKPPKARKKRSLGKRERAALRAEKAASSKGTEPPPEAAVEAGATGVVDVVEQSDSHENKEKDSGDGAAVVKNIVNGVSSLQSMLAPPEKASPITDEISLDHYDPIRLRETRGAKLRNKIKRSCLLGAIDCIAGYDHKTLNSPDTIWDFESDNNNLVWGSTVNPSKAQIEGSLFGVKEGDSRIFYRFHPKGLVGSNQFYKWTIMSSGGISFYVVDVNAAGDRLGYNFGCHTLPIVNFESKFVFIRATVNDEFGHLITSIRQFSVDIRPSGTLNFDEVTFTRVRDVPPVLLGDSAKYPVCNNLLTFLLGPKKPKPGLCNYFVPYAPTMSNHLGSVEIKYSDYDKGGVFVRYTFNTLGSYVNLSDGIKDYSLDYTCFRNTVTRMRQAKSEMPFSTASANFRVQGVADYDEVATLVCACLKNITFPKEMQITDGAYVQKAVFTAVQYDAKSRDDLKMPRVLELIPSSNAPFAAGPIFIARDPLSIDTSLEKRIIAPQIEAKERFYNFYASDECDNIVPGADVATLCSEYANLVIGDRRRTMKMGDVFEIVNGLNATQSARMRDCEELIRDSNGGRTEGDKMFPKNGHVTSDKANRVILTTDQKDSVNAGMIYDPMAKVFAATGHYGFLAPGELADSTKSIFLQAIEEGSKIGGTDVSSMDACINELCRKVEEAIVLGCLRPEFHNEAKRIMRRAREAVYAVKGRENKSVKLKDCRHTGSRDTTYGNCVTSGLFVYIAHRIEGYSSEQAWARKWLVAGDDTLFSGLSIGSLTLAAKVVGLKIPESKINLSEPTDNIDYLAFNLRYSAGSVVFSRCCKRQLNNFTIAADTGVKSHAVAKRKAIAYLSTFTAYSPLLFALASLFVRLSDDTGEVDGTGYYYNLHRSVFVEASNRFNNEFDTSEAEALIRLDDIADLKTTPQLYDEVVESITRAKSLDDLPATDWFYQRHEHPVPLKTLMLGDGTLLEAQC